MSPCCGNKPLETVEVSSHQLLTKTCFAAPRPLSPVATQCTLHEQTANPTGFSYNTNTELTAFSKYKSYPRDPGLAAGCLSWKLLRGVPLKFSRVA